MICTLKQKVVHFLSNLDLSNYYTKAEFDDSDNGLSTLILNPYNKREIYTCLTDYYNIEYVNIQFGLKSNSLNTYTKSEVDNIMNPLDIPSMLSIINNNCTNIVDILTTRYTKKQKLILLYRILIIQQKPIICYIRKSIHQVMMISCSLEAGIFRGGEIRIVSGDDLHALTLTQFTANGSIIDLRTEISFANMYLKVKGFFIHKLSTTNTLTLYKNTTTSGNLNVGKVLTLQEFQGYLIQAL